MILLIGAFIAGMLTVLAPCVLPLLPVIIGGSVSGDTTNKRRPLIISISLAVSLIVFTLLLKATTLLIDLPPRTINYISGTIIIALGIATLFPFLYEKLMSQAGITGKSQKLLSKGTEKKNPVFGSIVIGAALGPVFSSCSPVYAYIIATILPVNFSRAMVFIVAYVLGLCFVLFLVSVFSQRFISKIKWAANPRGVFQKVLAIVFIIVGILVFTSSTVKIQTYVSEHTPFDFDSLSSKLLPNDSDRVSQKGIFNVKAYDAPEFVGLEDWINSEPTTIKELKGKVVLIDFWTYSCINCIRTQPYLNSWYEAYEKEGFEIIGVHAPEFSFEKVPKNVQAAVKEAKLKYPIALDNDFLTWSAYQNQYWPAHYLIDAEGKVRRVHFGEGKYDEMDKAIRLLLEERNGKPVNSKSGDVNTGDDFREDQTPETYLGSRRAGEFTANKSLSLGENVEFKESKNLKDDQWTLDGTWDVSAESITAKKDAVLTIRVAAKAVYLVTGSPEAKSISIKLNGDPISETKFAGKDITSSKLGVQESRLYRIADFGKFSKGKTLRFVVPEGVTLNAFTFGS